LAAVLGALAFSSAAAARPVDASVVWKPKASLAEPLSRCHDGACVIRIMQRGGASKRAIWFSTTIASLGVAGEGYADKFMHYGPVDFIRVFRPHQGMEGMMSMLFVNGGPLIVDGSDWSRLQVINLMQSPVYRRIKASYPNADVWVTAEYAGQRKTSAGQTFLVRYPLLNGCHACDYLGSVTYGINFSRDGLFTGATLADVHVGQ